MFIKHSTQSTTYYTFTTPKGFTRDWSGRDLFANHSNRTRGFVELVVTDMQPTKKFAGGTYGLTHFLFFSDLDCEAFKARNEGTVFSKLTRYWHEEIFMEMQEQGHVILLTCIVEDEDDSTKTTQPIITTENSQGVTFTLAQYKALKKYIAADINLSLYPSNEIVISTWENEEKTFRKAFNVKE